MLGVGAAHWVIGPWLDSAVGKCTDGFRNETNLTPSIFTAEGWIWLPRS